MTPPEARAAPARLRAALVVDRYAPEARSVAHLFEDLAKALVGRGHEVLVLTKKPTENLPNGACFPGEQRLDGVRIVRMRRYLGEPRATLLKGLDQLLLAARVWLRLRFLEQPDVVLVYSPPLPLAAACAATGIPLVVNLHDLYPRTAVELGRLRSRWVIALAERLESYVYRRAESFVVPAPDSARYLVEEKSVSPTRVSLCYNWVDLTAVAPGEAPAFRRRHGLEGKFVVSYAGLVGVAQDLSAVVRAAFLSREDRELVFLVIGEGSELARWKEQAIGLPNIRFIPTLPRDLYLDSLRGSDVCLLALAAELRSPAIPGKLQNIMAVAKPVVAVVPSGSAAAQVVEASGCGLVASPGDGEGLLRAIQTLRADPALRERLGKAGRCFAEEHFRIERAVDEFETALRRAVS